LTLFQGKKTAFMLMNLVLPAVGPVDGGGGGDDDDTGGSHAVCSHPKSFCFCLKSPDYYCSNVNYFDVGQHFH